MATIKRKNEKCFETLSAHLKELDGKQVKIGWFESAVYPDGTKVAEVAAIQEFGSPSRNIPPRPFMRPTVMREGRNWIKLLHDGAKAVLKGTYTATEVMKAVGHKAKDDVQYSIDLVLSPPLSPKTIRKRALRRALRRKGQPVITTSITKPLIDTQKMQASCMYVVEDGK